MKQIDFHVGEWFNVPAKGRWLAVIGEYICLNLYPVGSTIPGPHCSTAMWIVAFRCQCGLCRALMRLGLHEELESLT